MSYSIEFRKLVMEHQKAGHSVEETSKKFKVSIPTIRNWETRLRERGTLEKTPSVRTFKKIDPERLRQYIETHPYARQKEIAEAFDCSSAAVRQAFRRLGITYKKGETIARKKTWNGEDPVGEE